MSVFNWGILGTGNIAGSMANALKLVPGANLYGVASRREESAKAFATNCRASHSYGSYEALLADPSIDIVYVATPNACHKENILAALSAGRHVLCEKPLTLSPADTRECARAAKRANLFLMEAMWMAFFPAMQKAVELVNNGAIGTPRHLTAQFISHRDPKASPNLFDPALGGGATLDLGIYPIAAALMLCGPAQSAKTEVIYGTTGVDEMVAMSLRHENEVISQLSFGFRAEMPISLTLSGDNGRLEISDNFHNPGKISLVTEKTQESIDLPPLGKGYAHEAIAVQKAIEEGRNESPIWPLAVSIACAELLDLDEKPGPWDPTLV